MIDHVAPSHPDDRINYDTIPLLDLRNHVLTLLACDLGCRNSDLANRSRDVRFVPPDHQRALVPTALISVHYSKTAKSTEDIHICRVDAVGEWRGARFIHAHNCSVRALEVYHDRVVRIADRKAIKPFNITKDRSINPLWIGSLLTKSRRERKVGREDGFQWMGIKAATIGNVLLKQMKEAGIQDDFYWTAHSLRAAMSSRLHGMGVATDAIIAHVGWASPSKITSKSLTMTEK